MMNQWQCGGIMFANLGDKGKRKQRKEKTLQYNQEMNKTIVHTKNQWQSSGNL